MSKALVMFDIDGTLVNSLGAEATYYPQACELALAIEEVSSNWGEYEHPSDSGIVQQVVALHFDRDATSEDGRCVEALFLSLLKEAYPRQPDLCRPIPGAHAAFQHARSLPNTTVSIATAGWSATALFKLGFAGFDVEGVPLASAHDGVSKQEIMRVSLARARACAAVESFSSVVYIGDSNGDVLAAEALGFEFIGIDTAGYVRDQPYAFPDFSERDRVFEAVLDLQAKAQRSQVFPQGDI